MIRVPIFGHPTVHFWTLSIKRKSIVCTFDERGTTVTIQTPSLWSAFGLKIIKKMNPAGDY